MKKILMAATLLTLSTASFAAVTTDTVLLKANVQKKLSIALSAEPVASALDLETDADDLKIATAVEKSNSDNGYKVTVSSANLGKLKRTAGSEVFAYSLKYNGSSVDLSSASGSIVTQNLAAGLVNESRDLNISYAGVAAEDMISGEYADTLTVVIAPN